MFQTACRVQVSILYTAPTAIRSLMAKGEAPVKKHKRTSLRVLGTVGEPINPEAWRWYYEVRPPNCVGSPAPCGLQRHPRLKPSL